MELLAASYANAITCYWPLQDLYVDQKRRPLCFPLHGWLCACFSPFLLSYPCCAQDSQQRAACVRCSPLIWWRFRHESIWSGCGDRWCLQRDSAGNTWQSSVACMLDAVKCLLLRAVPRWSSCNKLINASMGGKGVVSFSAISLNQVRIGMALRSSPFHLLYVARIQWRYCSPSCSIGNGRCACRWRWILEYSVYNKFREESLQPATEHGTKSRGPTW